MEKRAWHGRSHIHTLFPESIFPEVDPIIPAARAPVKYYFVPGRNAAALVLKVFGRLRRDGSPVVTSAPTSLMAGRPHRVRDTFLVGWVSTSLPDGIDLATRVVMTLVAIWLRVWHARWPGGAWSGGAGPPSGVHGLRGRGGLAAAEGLPPGARAMGTRAERGQADRGTGGCGSIRHPWTRSKSPER